MSAQCKNTSCAEVSPGTAPPEYVDPINSITADMVEVSIYILCLCTGGPLNVISIIRTCKAYLRDRRGRNQILLLRINLNVADLLTMFIYTPTQIIWMTTYQWYGGDILCRVCKFFYTFSFYLNSFVIADIAIDRVCSAYRLQAVKSSEGSFKRVRRSLIAAYICAVICSVPQIFIFRVFHPAEMGDFRQCTPVWTVLAYELDIQLDSSKLSEKDKQKLIANYLQAIRWEKLYNIAHLLLVFWVPTLIITISYIFVICKLKSLSGKEYRKVNLENEFLTTPKQQCSENGSGLSIGNVLPIALLTRKSIISENSENNNDYANPLSVIGGKRASQIGTHARRTVHRATKVATRQAAMILLAYLTLWSPYNVLAMMNLFASSSSERSIAQVTLTFLNALIVVNPVVNPIIYGLFQSPSKRDVR
ncbi:hypothetical protein AB6A40_005526 [Gnathostoma spinigerum]|uniref:G-protein coupled receptors family 1 profile domain-containing protein n=1 Tax=Gnathostoma spinigerum TaxID=75299 RepID=A0ABD6EQI0_9BILA